MRSRVRAVLILSGCLFGSAPACADSDSGTAVVIPGRPDVPVIINPYGFDASYTIVEGDFGLNKPAMVNASIVVGPHVVRVPGPRRHYFPHSDEMPGYGRLEIQPPPNRVLPPPAQSYSRSWGTASDPLPASTDPAYPMTVNPVVGPYGPWQAGGRDHGRDLGHDRGRDRDRGRGRGRAGAGRHAGGHGGRGH
jgi:hypothetical protein